MAIGKRKQQDSRKTRRRLLIELAVIIVFLLIWLWTWVPFTEHISLDLAPGSGSTVRLLLITDLHSCYYGPHQEWLTDMVDKEDPDLIILSGDIYDDKISDRNTDIFMQYIAGRYPCFYVTGNHEYWSGRAEEMKEKMRGYGVSVLEGSCETFTAGGLTFDICGVDDPAYMNDSQWISQIDSAYEETDPSHVRILVSHRPERVDIYERYGFDLILTGHAHAGQFRIPFINRGVLAPDQGFMAEYVNGTYTLSNGSIMEVSRGLARESTPLPRFFNHPEIVVIDIS